jgi:hypothetical protein
MNNNLDNNSEKFPKGQFVGMWMGIGIAIFSGLGIPISIITENYGFIGIGTAIGIVFGLLIGQSIENKYSREGRIRPLTESEKINRQVALNLGKKIAITIGIALLTIGILFFLFMYFKN